MTDAILISNFSLSADKRQGNCYLQVNPDRRRPSRGGPVPCSGDLGRDMSRATCCCTSGLGWGQTPGMCDACPRNGTRT
jgi:hypothetical protein